MDNDHGITGELRKWARDNTVQDKVLTTYPVQHPVHGTVESLLRIADRIDAEHDRAIASVMNDALYHANDKDMAELGWVRLPKDADGKYIHVGDEMDELDARCPGTPTTFTVADMFYQGNDRWHLRAYQATYDPKTCCHHHEPTVEDVLCELLDKVDDDRAGQAEIIAEYAKKLQLRGDEQ